MPMKNRGRIHTIVDGLVCTRQDVPWVEVARNAISKSDEGVTEASRPIKTEHDIEMYRRGDLACDDARARWVASNNSRDQQAAGICTNQLLIESRGQDSGSRVVGNRNFKSWYAVEENRHVSESRLGVGLEWV
jgi:hypothetical protein